MKSSHNFLIKASEITLIIFWLMTMKDSDSLFIPYLLVGIFGILCCTKRTPFKKQPQLILVIVFAAILTFFVSIANYSLFLTFSFKDVLLCIVQYLSIVGGSFVVFYNIFSYLPNLSTHIKNTPAKKSKSKFISKIAKLKPYQIFLISFGAISLAYLLVFFLCKYPGNLSFDSLNQVKQGLLNDYSNHHPFLHTIIIKFFVEIGQNLFGNINAGVACYSVFQILLTSSIFAFSLSTLHRARVSPRILIILLLIYLLTPYHIMYSMTIWKDCMLAIFFLLFVLSCYRLFQNLGVRWPNFVLLFLSGFCTCVFKGNGLYIIVAFTILFTILFWRNIFVTKKFSPYFIILVSIVSSAFLYNKIILPAFDVKKGEIMESLSVPAQQIARVVRDSNDLTANQQELLGHISNLEKVPIVYNPHLSDPIKEQVWFSSGGEDYLSEHKGEYLKLYLELGITHPFDYLHAWADQTKGYFNGGYKYWVISNDITENTLDIYQTNINSAPNKIFNIYLSLFEDNSTLRIIYCIGFFVWSALGLLYIAIIKHNKTTALLISAPLFLIATLWLAAPVYSEFRYAYPLLCCLPFLAIITLHPSQK